MPSRRSLIRGLRCLALFLFVFLSSLAQVARAQNFTSATLLNPQSTNEHISARLGTKSYLLNGTCFRADAVEIHIYTSQSDADADIVANQIGGVTGTINASVHHGVWEAKYSFVNDPDLAVPAPNLFALRYIKVVPSLQKKTGIGITRKIYVEAETNLLGGELLIHTGLAASGVYARKQKIADTDITLKIQPLAIVSVGAADTIDQIALVLKAPDASLTPVENYTTNLQTINDNASPPVTPPVPLTGIPSNYRLQNAMNGIYTLRSEYRQAGLTRRYYRSIIVDTGEPTINTSAVDSEGTLTISGYAQDEGSGIESVEVIVESGTSPKHYFAELAYGNEPGSRVAYKLILKNISITGTNPVTVVANDNAGNKKSIDIAALEIKKGVSLDFLEFDQSNPVTPSPTFEIQKEPTTNLYYVRGMVKIKGRVDISNLNVDPVRTSGFEEGWRLYAPGVVDVILPVAGTNRIATIGYLTDVNIPANPALWDTNQFPYNGFDTPQNPLSLHLRATTSSGQVFEASTSLNVVVDNVPPTVTISSPTLPGGIATYVKGTTTINVSVTEKNPGYFEMYIGGKKYTKKTDAGTKFVPSDGSANDEKYARVLLSGVNPIARFTWETNDPEANPGGDGEHTLSVVVTDKAGNQSNQVASAYTVHVINQPLRARLNKLDVGTGTLRHSVAGNLPGAIVGGGPDPNVVNPDVPDPTRVTFEIRAGNSLSVNDKLLKWEVFANEVSLSQSGGTVDTITGLASVDWNTKSSSDGPATLTLKFTDKAGFEQTITTNVTVDNTRPVLDIISPKTGSKLEPGTAITSYINEINQRGLEANYKYSQGLIAITLPYSNDTINTIPVFGYTGTVQTPFVFAVPLSVTLEAKDEVGNKASKAITVSIEASKPVRLESLEFESTNVLSDISPFVVPRDPATNLYYVRGKVKINGVVDVSNLNINNVAFEKGWVLYIPSLTSEKKLGEGTDQIVVSSDLTRGNFWNTAEPFDATFNSFDDKFSINLRATTQTGQVIKAPVSLDVVVDNMPPTVTILPLHSSGGIDDYVRGIVTIEAKVTEKNPSYFQMYIGDKLYTQKGGTGAFVPADNAGDIESSKIPLSGKDPIARFTWETNNETANANPGTAKSNPGGDGVHALSIVVTDKAGNQSNQALSRHNVTVINDPLKARLVSFDVGSGGLRHTLKNLIGAVVGGGTGNSDVPDPTRVTFEISSGNSLSVNDRLLKWEVFANENSLSQSGGTVDATGTRGPTIGFARVDWNTKPSSGNPFPDGPATLTLKFTDRAGGEQTIAANVTVDNTQPEPLFTGPFPLNNAFVNKQISITGNVVEVNFAPSDIDPTPTDKRSNLMIGANLYNLGDPNRKPIKSLSTLLEDWTPLASVDAKAYVLNWTVMDAVGNKGSASQTVYVGDPAARLTFPSVPPENLLQSNQTPWDSVATDRNAATDRNQVAYTKSAQVLGEVKNWSRYRLFDTGPNPLTEPDLLNPSNPPLKSLVAVATTIAHDTNAPIVPIKKGTMQTWPLNEGRHRLRLQAINDNGNTSDDPENLANKGGTNIFGSNFASAEIVVDDTKPVVEFQSPTFVNDHPFPVAPGSILTVTFTITNSNGPGVGVMDVSPLMRLYKTTPETPASAININPPNSPIGNLTEFPVVYLEIPEADFSSLLSDPNHPKTFDLYRAITRPSLTEPNGKATLVQEGNKTRITWQLPIVPLVYAYNVEYIINIRGVQDLVGNTADTQTANFRVSVN